jgi:hypothetical protein
MRNLMLSTAALGFVFLLLSPSEAHAQRGVGVRTGISARPNQFFIGAHADVAPVLESVWFRPNAEAGFGDNTTTIAFNFEFVYWIPMQRRWNVYVGGGPAAVITTFSRPGGRDSNAGPGFNLLLGLGQRRGFMGEIKVGALDSPDVKFTVGWTF